jgi:hypothetical protein
VRRHFGPREVDGDPAFASARVRFHGARGGPFSNPPVAALFVPKPGSEGSLTEGVVTPEEAVALAMEFEGAKEAPHFTMRSFRVGGRLYATLPPEETHLHVFVDEHAARAYAAAETACEELWWGRRLCGVRVLLSAVEPELLRELLEAAWERKAPARLRR